MCFDDDVGLGMALTVLQRIADEICPYLLDHAGVSKRRRQRCNLDAGGAALLTGQRFLHGAAGEAIHVDDTLSQRLPPEPGERQ